MDEHDLRAFALQIAKEIHASNGMSVDIKRVIEDAKLILQFLEEH